MKRTRPRMIRATLRRRDGSYVRRVPLTDHDDFMFCLLTGAYYDRTPGTRTFVERFWPHHNVRIRELNAATSADPLDVYRAEAGYRSTSTEGCSDGSRCQRLRGQVWKRGLTPRATLLRNAVPKVRQAGSAKRSPAARAQVRRAYTAEPTP